MITEDALAALVKEHMPDADVLVYDRTGTQDHLLVHVTSAAFVGKGLMERHRMVQKSLDAAMKDGRIHALEIKTEVRSS